MEGWQYQFSVSVTLSVGGHLFTGIPGMAVDVTNSECVSF